MYIIKKATFGVILNVNRACAKITFITMLTPIGYVDSEYITMNGDRNTPVSIALNIMVPTQVLYLEVFDCFNDCGLRIDIQGCLHQPQGRHYSLLC